MSWATIIRDLAGHRIGTVPAWEPDRWAAICAKASRELDVDPNDLSCEDDEDGVEWLVVDGLRVGTIEQERDCSIKSMCKTMLRCGADHQAVRTRYKRPLVRFLPAGCGIHSAIFLIDKAHERESTRELSELRIIARWICRYRRDEAAEIIDAVRVRRRAFQQAAE
jgi:hypothetical protein